MMASVCLVQMPYAALERPSLALGLLHAQVESAGIACRSVYANLPFARAIGIEAYVELDRSNPSALLGEWTFSEAAFRDRSPARDLYLSRLRFPPKDSPRSIFGTIHRGLDLLDILPLIREEARRFIEELAELVLASNPRIVGCSSTSCR